MLGSAQGINIVCSVLRNKLMAIWVGAAGVGFNSILVNASALISTATQLNIRDSAVRDLSSPMAPGALALKTAAVRRWAIILGLIGTCAAVILSPLLSAMAYGGSYDRAIYFILLAPAVFATSYTAGEFAILQSRGRLKAIATASAVGGVAATIISLPLIYLYRLASIVYVIDIYAVATAICAYFACQRIDTTAAAQDLGLKILWKEGRSFLLLGFSISVSVLLSSVSNYVFSAYVSSMSGESALGIYQSGYTMINSYVGIIFSAIAVEYYPRLARLVNHPRMAQTVMTHEFSIIVRLVTPVAVVFVALSDFLVRMLYSSQFDGVVPFITFAIIGTVFRGTSLCYAYRILASGDSRAFIFTESVSVTVGLTLNILAYGRWSYAGLGVSYIVWYAFYTVLTAVVCHRRYGVKLPRKLITLTLASVAVIASAIAMKLLVSWWLPVIILLPAMIILFLTRRLWFKKSKG